MALSQHKIISDMSTIVLLSVIELHDVLNENGPPRLVYLNSWSSVGATICEKSGGVALLKKICN